MGTEERNWMKLGWALTINVQIKCVHTVYKSDQPINSCFQIRMGILSRLFLEWSTIGPSKVVLEWKGSGEPRLELINKILLLTAILKIKYMTTYGSKNSIDIPWLIYGLLLYLT